MLFAAGARLLGAPPASPPPSAPRPRPAARSRSASPSRSPERDDGRRRKRERRERKERKRERKSEKKGKKQKKKKKEKHSKSKKGRRGGDTSSSDDEGRALVVARKRRRSPSPSSSDSSSSGREGEQDSFIVLRRGDDALRLHMRPGREEVPAYSLFGRRDRPPPDREPPPRYWAADLRRQHRDPSVAYVRVRPSSPPAPEQEDFLRLGEGEGEGEGEEQEGETAEQARVNRTRALNVRVREHPEDEDAWVALVEAQPELHPDASQSVLVDRQLSIYGRALQACPGSSRLRMAQLRLACAALPTEGAARLWDAALRQAPQDVDLRLAFLGFAAGQFSSFSVTPLRALYAQLLAEMGTDEGKMRVLYAYCRFEMAAGFTERAVGVAQAVVDFNVGRGDRLQYFRSFWVSDAPRVGEGEEGGFARWYAKVVERSGPGPASESLPPLQPKEEAAVRSTLPLPEPVEPEPAEPAEPAEPEPVEPEPMAVVEEGYSTVHGYRLVLDAGAVNASTNSLYRKILSELQDEAGPLRREERKERKQRDREPVGERLREVGDDDPFLLWLAAESRLEARQWLPLKEEEGQGGDENDAQIAGRSVAFEDLQPFLFTVSPMAHERLLGLLLRLVGLSQTWAAPFGDDEGAEDADNDPDIELLCAHLGPELYPGGHEVPKPDPSRRWYERPISISAAARRDASRLEFLRSALHFGCQIIGFSVDLRIALLAFEADVGSAALEVGRALLQTPLAAHDLRLWAAYARLEPVVEARKVYGKALELAAQLGPAERAHESLLMWGLARLELAQQPPDPEAALYALSAGAVGQFRRKQKQRQPVAPWDARRAIEQCVVAMAGDVASDAFALAHLLGCHAVFELLLQGPWAAAHVVGEGVKVLEGRPTGATEWLLAAGADVLAGHPQPRRPIVELALRRFPQRAPAVERLLLSGGASLLQLRRSLRGRGDSLHEALLALCVEAEGQRRTGHSRLREELAKARGVLLRRAAVRFDLVQGRVSAAKRGFYAAVRAHPGSKRLWLDALRVLRGAFEEEELNDLMDQVSERGLFLRGEAMYV